MEEELKALKTVLRSLVVSSPTEVDLRALLRDYRNIMGAPLPLNKFGYRDALSFIRERCDDCFVVQQPGPNPVLTLIVPDTVKHIDKFVQKQKSSSTTKFKVKRRSIPESAIRKPNDLIARTFKPKANCTHIDNNANINNNDIIEEHRDVNNKATNQGNDGRNGEIRYNGSARLSDERLHVNDKESSRVIVRRGTSSDREETRPQKETVQKRMAMLTSSHDVDSDAGCEEDSCKGDKDSGRMTSSTNSSRKQAQFEELKAEIRDLISEVPEGVWCTDIMRLYREKYGRELNFHRFGVTCVLSLAYAVEGLRFLVYEATGRVRALAAEPGRGGEVAHERAPEPRPPRAPARAPRAAREPRDDEDALPGISFDPDVFPEDCMHILQSVPPPPLEGLAEGAVLKVVLGEVYSPSHFWFLRLHPDHYSAMEDIMDEMNAYYQGEGRERTLALGAVRVGHYCGCCYEGDWHRAVIVKLVDSETVKVRHIDYATVETVAVGALKPLLQRWGALPAQALRGRLAGARPPAAGRRWPWPSSAHFLRLVRERNLVATVVARDLQEGILELVLVDTSGEDDVSIGAEMCRAGHADPRSDSALATSEPHLFPRFDALESGATPNYEEIYCYLRDGILLEFVEDYRRHVPPSLPPAPRYLPSPSPSRSRSPSPPTSPSPPSPPSPAAASPPPRSPSPPSPPRYPTWCDPSTVGGRYPLPSPSADEPIPEPPTEPADQSPAEPVAASPDHQPSNQYRSLPAFPGFPGFANSPPPYPHPQPQPHPYALPFNRPHPHPQSPYPSPSPQSPLTSASSAMHLSPHAPPFYPHAWPAPYVAFHPAPAPPPPPPPAGVFVPASEYEIFELLGRVDPAAAHRYIVDALARAAAATRLAHAAGYPRPAPPPPPAFRPPPGFESVVPRP